MAVDKDLSLVAYSKDGTELAKGEAGTGKVLIPYDKLPKRGTNVKASDFQVAFTDGKTTSSLVGVPSFVVPTTTTTTTTTTTSSTTTTTTTTTTKKPVAPEAPTLKAVDDKNGGINFTVTDPANVGDAPISSRQIQYGDKTLDLGNKKTGHLDLTAGTEYSFTATVTSSVGTSPKSAVVKATPTTTTTTTTTKPTTTTTTTTTTKAEAEK